MTKRLDEEQVCKELFPRDYIYTPTLKEVLQRKYSLGKYIHGFPTKISEGLYRLLTFGN